MKDVSWHDHLLHAAACAGLVADVAAKVPDPETKDALLTVAREIGKHIEKGRRQVQSEMDALDPVNPPP